MRSLTTLAIIAAVTLSMNAQAQTKKKAAKPAPAPEAAAPASSSSAPAEEPAAKPAAKKAPLHDQFSGTGYGLAGCGLGSIVFGAKPGMVQIAAATTNNWIFPQTFAITSGTSNCDIPEMGHQAALFIEVNKETVRKEAARGQGETVSDLAQIFNCKDTAVFGRKMQQNYENIFNHDNAFDSTREIINTIKQDAELGATCDQLS